MNPSSGRTQYGGYHRALARRLVILEGIILLLAAPFLFVPEASPIATVVAMLALGMIWLISLFVSPPPSTPFNFVLILWGSVLIVGILVTADPVETLPKATGLILGLAVWRFVVLAVQSRRHVNLFVALLLLLGVGFSLVGLFGLQELPKIPFLAEINPFRFQTLPGLGDLAIHPNEVAGLICIYLPLLVSLLFSPPPGLPNRRLRLILFFATLMTVAILILTQSRGGWIGATAGLLALVILWALVLPPSASRRSLRLLAAAIVLAGLAAVAWISPTEIRDLWLNPPEKTAVGTLETLNYRKELWPWAITAVADFPFSGVGLGAFRQVAFRLYPIPMPREQDIGHAHNIFLQTALDVGLPGLAIYLAILFVAATTGWRVARRDAGFRSVSLGLLAGLVAVHIFGLADALALGSKPAIIFWLALGLLTVMNKEISAP